MEIMNVIGQGMGVDQDRLTAIAINLANARTPAYKRELVNGAAFEAQMDALERQASGASAAAPSALSLIHISPTAIAIFPRNPLFALSSRACAAGISASEYTAPTCGRS